MDIRLMAVAAVMLVACSNTPVTPVTAEKPYDPPQSDVTSVKRNYAAEANENPFLNGQLNPLYEGEKAALRGQVIDIKPTKQQFPLYKLELDLEGVNPIWATSIGAVPPEGIQRGDVVIFRGFIGTVSELDPSGEVEAMIRSNTLLIAVHSQMVKKYQN